MRVLLDTHALLWWMHEPEELSDLALRIIADGENDISVSAVSAMEVATKQRLGKLEYDTPLANQFVNTVAALGFAMVPIGCDHAQQAGALPGLHRDPWDRLLSAQAQLEGLTLVSKDKEMNILGTTTIW